MTQRLLFPKQTIASIALLLTATALITFSDYLTAQNAALDNAGKEAARISLHLRNRFEQILHGDLSPLAVDPDRYGAASEDMRRVAVDFGLFRISLLDERAVIIVSSDRESVGGRFPVSEAFERAVKGQGSSRILKPHEPGWRPVNSTGLSLIETLSPVRKSVGESGFWVLAVDQDYGPTGHGVLRDAVRSSLTHVLLLLVFAALFFRYGRFTAQSFEKHDQDLIDNLENRVLERTLELQESRQRVSDLLARREDSFRDLVISDEYKRNFIGLVSHELRTPLTVVKGYLALLKSGVIDAPGGEATAEALDASLRETGKLETIINNILELGRLDRGLLKVFPEAFSVRELAEEAISLVDSELAERNIQVKLVISPEVGIFTTDRMMLLQVAYQYLSNAAKFSPEGGRVEFAVGPGHRGFVLSVRDEGPGVPEARTDDIFDLFYQVDISSTRSHEGSGLGLAIVRRVARILGGRAWVESEPGRGSTFLFEAPIMEGVSRPDEAQEGPAPSRSIQGRTRQPGGSVLVVDDDDDFRDLVGNLLSTRGYAVELARDGLEALNRLFMGGAPPPSLVLLDVRMPYINGLDVCRIIRRSVLTREIPVIMVSALATEFDIRAGHESGANAYFTKPFDPDELTARIAFLLDATA